MALGRCAVALAAAQNDMATVAAMNPQYAQVTIRVAFGRLSDEQREALTEAVRGSLLGQVRLDEAIHFNLGIGAAPSDFPGLPITADVFLSVVEGTAAGLLTIAIREAVRPAFRALRAAINRWVTVVRRDEREPVSYVIEDAADAEAAFDAMPADYEIHTKSETRTRAWRDGRWELYEASQTIVRGTKD
jgi:hypothetical protein